MTPSKVPRGIKFTDRGWRQEGDGELLFNRNRVSVLQESSRDGLVVELHSNVNVLNATELCTLKNG